MNSKITLNVADFSVTYLAWGRCCLATVWDKPRFMAPKVSVHACVSVFMHDADMIDVFGERFVCVGSCV